MKPISIAFFSTIALSIVYIPIAIMAWSESMKDKSRRPDSLDWAFGLMFSSSIQFNEKGKRFRLYGAAIEIGMFSIWALYFLFTNK